MSKQKTVQNINCKMFITCVENVLLQLHSIAFCLFKKLRNKKDQNLFPVTCINSFKERVQTYLVLLSAKLGVYCKFLATLIHVKGEGDKPL